VNWCECDLTVAGAGFEECLRAVRNKGAREGRALRRMRDAYDPRHDLFNPEKISPRPFRSARDRDWRQKNWGTIWLCDVVIKRKTVRTAKLSFKTAWGPPGPLILKLSELFPDLTFTLKYFECGMAFQGVYVCKGGMVLKDCSEWYGGKRGG